MSFNESQAASLGEKCGFLHLLTSDLEEINGVAHVFVHKASGARLLYLQNDDTNKSFSVSFKTPAFDNTGVFHILEHSVLCGSKKFPVKEPFVTLLKSSMQTFLNAMTFPDKTVYPVASTNEQDLMNLMDVYLDAVFYPNIYSNKCIFEQEGWHLELAEDDSGKLAYNGVVFNEMKGALSDPDQVLYDSLCKSLYPDTTYGFESGGVPSDIPNLTYDAFLQAHRKHYSPGNSYIVLYGDLNAEKFMQRINDDYLSPLSDAHTNYELPQIELQKPIVADDVCQKMVTAPDNSCLGFGYVVGQASQRERLAAISILLDAIMGSNEAPLKRALLESDLADDFEVFLSESMLQPFVMLSARGLRNNAQDKMLDVVETCVKKLSGSAGQKPTLDLALLEASLSRAEFQMREFDFGYPDGVMLAISSLSGWLYNDEPLAATSNLRYEELFKFLRDKLKTDYYFELLSEIFLDNNHRAKVEVAPVEAGEVPDKLAERLLELESEFSAADYEKVAKEVELLRAHQMSSDSPENLAKLPHLTRADIGQAPYIEQPQIAISKDASTLRHVIDTHGISYFSQYFNISKIGYENLAYASVLAILLGKLDTASHSASEIDTLTQSILGSFKVACEVFSVKDENPRITFSVVSSCLALKTREAAHLVREILTTTNFSDKQRVCAILVQTKVMLEQRFSSSGNATAIARSASYVFADYVLREQISGIDFYVFLKNLIEKISSDEIDFAEKMTSLANEIFGSPEPMLSFAGDEDSLNDLVSVMGEFPTTGFSAAAENSHPVLGKTHVMQAPLPTDKHEAFVVPSDVTYSALACNMLDLSKGSATFSGAWLVLSRIMSLDYLWNAVRVVGGAYGAEFAAGRTGLASFSSYRDPHVSETLERFKQAAGWLDEFEPSEEEFEGYIVSAAASFDKPQKPRSLARTQATMFLSRYAYSQLLEYRRQVIDTSLDDVKALAASLGEMSEKAPACVVGNEKIIEDSGVAKQGMIVLNLLEFGNG